MNGLDRELHMRTSGPSGYRCRLLVRWAVAPGTGVCDIEFDFVRLSTQVTACQIKE